MAIKPVLSNFLFRGRKLKILNLILAGSFIPLIQPQVVIAQESTMTLEEIVVTSRRREESLQEIPIAITAFSGETLEAGGVERVENLNGIAPNLAVHGGSGQTVEASAAFMIRGMEGVAVYVDGIDQRDTGLFTMGLVDVERVEVLRGPQGTLFGTASIGGAVNYVTARPGDEFSANIKTKFGDLNRREVNASVDLPLIEDTLLTKVTYANNQRDGYVISAVNGQDYGNVNDSFLRTDLLWNINDSMSLRHTWDNSEQGRNDGARVTWDIGPKTVIDTANGGAIVDTSAPGYDPTNPDYINTNAPAQAWENSFGFLYDNQHAAAGFPGGDLGDYESLVSHTGQGLVLDLERHTLDFDWAINDRYRVRALYGTRRTETFRIVEHDGDSRINFGDRAYYEDFDDKSYEIQFHGSFGAGDQVTWVLGYNHAETYFKDRDQRLNMNLMVCDLMSGSARSQYGITIADEAACFNARARGLGVEDLYQANTGMTHAEIADMWTDVVALNPSLHGVHTWDYSTGVSGNGQAGSSIRFNKNENSGWFGDVTWAVTDQLTVSAGLRTQKDKDLGEYDFSPEEWYPFNAIDAELANPFAGTVSDTPRANSTGEYEATTGRLSVQYQWNPDMMTYASYANGYQPGGSGSPASSLRNLDALDTSDSWTFGEQTVVNMEVGMKADWLNGRLRTNVTAFHTNWENAPAYQYPATIYWDTDGDGAANDGDLDNDGVQEGPAQGLIPCFNRCDSTGMWEVFFVAGMSRTAVGEVEISGVEVEAQWLPTDNSMVGINLGTLSSEIKDIGPAALGVVPAMEPGDKFRGMPDMSYKLWGQYDWNLANGASLTLRGDYTWTDDVVVGQGEQWSVTVPSFALINARLTYDSGDNWRAYVAGTNLTDEVYSLTGFKSQAQQVYQGSAGRPREVYLGLDFRF